MIVAIFIGVIPRPELHVETQSKENGPEIVIDLKCMIVSNLCAFDF